MQEGGKNYAGVIRNRRKQAGLSQEELAARLGISRNTLAGWETGHSRPDLNAVPDLCRALRISLNTFFGLKESRSFEEKRILNLFFSLEAGDREVLEWQMEALAERRAEKRRQDALEQLIVLHRSDLGAAAGIGTMLEEAHGEEFVLVRNEMTEQADEVIAVSGNSMEPTFYDGDEVLVQHCSELRPGEIGIFLVENEGYIKEYRKDGLHSHNSAYPVMKFGAGESVRCVGRVLGKVEEDQLPTKQQLTDLEEARKGGRREIK